MFASKAFFFLSFFRSWNMTLWDLASLKPKGVCFKDKRCLLTDWEALQLPLGLDTIISECWLSALLKQAKKKPRSFRPFGLRIKPHLENIKVDLNVLSQTHFCSIPPWNTKKKNNHNHGSKKSKSQTHPNDYTNNF